MPCRPSSVQGIAASQRLFRIQAKAHTNQICSVHSAAADFIARPSRGGPRHPASTLRGTRFMEEAIRVDQAGEIAANWIYRGQYAILGKDKGTGPVIQEMWDQEKKHLKVMNKLQQEYNVRPTLLAEAAKGAGFLLGAGTALLGKEAAMTCTEAVETAIGEHYNDQLRELKILNAGAEAEELTGIIQELRDDELEHLDTAVKLHAQRAPAHALLASAIEAGCNVAIAICKRI